MRMTKKQILELKDKQLLMTKRLLALLANDAFIMDLNIVFKDDGKTSVSIELQNREGIK